MLSASKTFLYLFASLFFLITSFHTSNAQLVEKTLENKKRRDVRSPLRSIFDNARQTDELKPSPFDLDPQLQSLEAAVDPETYVVGPGDVFLVNVWAMEEVAFNIPVTPEGKLTIPTIGALAIDGKTLAEVQAIVTEAASKKYLQAAVTAHLIKLRTFRVHLTGQVMNPGLYEALAVDRVSDVIKRADGLTSWGSEREIEVRHRDGTSELVDLYRYKKLGELETNIVLQAGDVVYVPPIQFSRATVRIEGKVNRPGVYQLAQNETLQDLLLRVDALNKDADLTDAYIRRKGTSNGSVETIQVFPYLQAQGNSHSDLVLQDGDVVMIPPRQEEVYVIGAVLRPGPYAYYPNLRAIDYVGFAGATGKATGLSKIQVFRQNGAQADRGANQIVGPGDTVSIKERAQFGFREVVTLVATVTNVLLAMKAVGVF